MKKIIGLCVKIIAFAHSDILVFKTSSTLMYGDSLIQPRINHDNKTF